MPKPVTMRDIREDEDDDDKNTRYGVGGSSAQSGGGSDQQVMGWGKEQWEAAKKDGVTEGDFGPQGNDYRFRVTFWKNGFSVNDGPLRTGESPPDQLFLQSIHEKRECPQELLAEAAGKEPVVDLVDKSGQNYEAPPKPAFASFSGSGQTMGGGNQTAAVQLDSSAPLASSDYKLDLDESQKTTKLQLMFHDGSKIVQKFNLTHTVQDVRLFMESQQPLPQGTCFELHTTYPTAVLTDHSVTIQDGGLKGQAMQQKLC